MVRAARPDGASRVALGVLMFSRDLLRLADLPRRSRSAQVGRFTRLLFTDSDGRRRRVSRLLVPMLLA